MIDFKNMPLSEKENIFFKLDYVEDYESVPFKINADFIFYHCYEESPREMMVSYYPMMPLLENTVPFEEADYILYGHCYARIRDMSNIVLRELLYIDKHRKPGAEIIVVGKSANIESVLNGYIKNITFLKDHFTEKLGKKFNMDIKEEYFVYDDRFDALNIWPVDGCNKKCAFCRRTYMDIKFESIPIEQIKEELDKIRHTNPERLKHICLRAENLTEYGLDIGGKQELASLIKLIDSYKEVETISFPIGMCISEITPEILDALCECKKIDQIYLNIETGSDRLLKLINKGHDKKKCLEVFKKLRKAHPNLYIVSNIMIGLPTEELIDIYELVDFVCELDIDYLWINYFGVTAKLPLAKLPQLSPQLREYHLKLFLNMLYKREDNPLLRIGHPRILDKKKRSTHRILESLAEEQKNYDNGLSLGVDRTLKPKSKELRKVPELRF
ncbi:MAG: radical SAM protein [Bacilli bacterium]|nr:radical SAM protein [Bacilli bacterium]